MESLRRLPASIQYALANQTTTRLVVVAYDLNGQVVGSEPLNDANYRDIATLVNDAEISVSRRNKNNERYRTRYSTKSQVRA